jgi:UDP:flavonoid glycosyltransferase YjiC (YdhE family)
MKRVLVTPLDWGLGHATRCIPVIRELLLQGCDVYLAGSGDSLKLLQLEFPSLQSFSIPGYDPVYPTSGQSMLWKMASQLPKFIRAINEEHQVIEALIVKHKVDLVISDNRYGCWSAKVPCVFITHQSNILMPKRFGWLAPLVRTMNERMMKKFSICWIPDFSGDRSLAGDLISFGNMDKAANIRHIGWLSRFTSSHAAESKYDLLCIFSGPEPQRSRLEEIVVNQLKGASLKVLVVRGLPGSPAGLKTNTSAEVVNFLGAQDLQEAIRSAKIVLARSGFSTVMDLVHLGGKAVFIPTPGQTEQVYLAKRLMERKIAYSVPQEHFDLGIALRESEKYTGFPFLNSNDSLLKNAVDEALMLNFDNLKVGAKSTWNA